MCYYVEQKASRSEIKQRFGIGIDNETKQLEGGNINCFSFPNVPIITNDYNSIKAVKNKKTLKLILAILLLLSTKSIQQIKSPFDDL